MASNLLPKSGSNFGTIFGARNGTQKWVQKLPPFGARLIQFPYDGVEMGPILGPILGIDFGSENGFRKAIANVARHSEKRSTAWNFKNSLFWILIPLTCNALHEASGFWQWSDHLQRRAREIGKEPILINLDETSVSRSAHDAVGLIVTQRWLGDEPRPGQPISRQQLRGTMSHVALISPHPEVQALLPQFFLGNYRMFPQSLMAHMASQLPSNV